MSRGPRGDQVSATINSRHRISFEFAHNDFFLSNSDSRLIIRGL
ncbi:hypothetical protein Hanom_Chr00s024632g01763761 [Helianthus anomalus]